MARERGDLDLSREQIASRESYVPDQRSVASLRSDVSREDLADREVKVAREESDGVVPQLLKFGLVAAGTVAFGRLLHSTEGGVRILDAIGRYGGGIARGTKRWLMSELEASAAVSDSARSALALARQREAGRLGDLPFVDSISQAIDHLGGFARRDPVSVHGTEWFRAVRELAPNARQVVPRGHRLLTAGDVTGEGAFRSLVSDQQRAILEEGTALGMVDAATPLAKGLMVGPGGVVRDVRWATGRGLYGMAKRGLDQVQIPFINFRLGALLEVPGRIFGRDESVRWLKPGSFVPGQGELSRGGFSIGGKVFDYGRDMAYLGRYQTFERKGNSLLSRTVGSMYNRVEEGAGSYALDAAQRKTGIGTRYADSRSFFSRLVLDPIRRMSRGTLVPKRNVSATAGKSFLDRMAYHLAGVKGNVENTLQDAEGLSFLRRVREKAKAAFGKSEVLEYRGVGPRGAVPGVRAPTPPVGLPGQDVALFPAKDRGKVFANWLAARQSNLFSQLLGIGFRPGKGAHGYLGSAARIAGIWYGALGAWNAARYADYQIEDTTGVSPIKGAAWLYTRARIAQNTLREGLGITAAARYAEDLMPLSMSSTLSGVARTILPPLIGGTMGGKRGLLGGLAASALLGGIPGGIFTPEDILKTGKELSEEYSGERGVAVRRNRWWEFNAEEFSGGAISHYEPSWYAKLSSDYKYSDVLFGSQGNYWKKVSRFPTPSNWFGLRSILEPDWLASQQGTRRPYPVHPGMLWNSAPGGLGLGGTAGDLGLGHLSSPIANAEGNLGSELSDLYERSTEFLGIYKFAFESVTGIKAPFRSDVALASADEMTSLHKSFWDSNIGGLGGVTEALRRFLLPRNTQPRTVNPLPNEMPGWLPGSRSMFKEDTRYAYDFHRGDPYCLSGHTAVVTTTGLLDAGDVSVGDEIITHMGREMPVRGVAVRSVRSDERCYRVILRGLTAFPIVASEDHPFYVLHPLGPGKTPLKEWRKAQDLRDGDRVLLPLPVTTDVEFDLKLLIGHPSTEKWTYLFKDQESAEIFEFLESRRDRSREVWGQRRALLWERGWSRRKYESQQGAVRRGARVHRLPRHLKVDENIAYLLGIYAAEGSAGGSSVGFGLHNGETYIRENIDSALAPLGLAGTWRRVGNGGNYVIGSRLLAEVLATLVPGKATTKRLDRKLMQLDRAKTLRLLQGLFEGDGSFFTYRSEGKLKYRLSLKTTSRDLAYQVWILLLRVGFRANLTAWTPPSGGIAKARVYSLTLNGSHALRLASEFGYSIDEVPPQHSSFEWFRDGYAVIPIKRIEEAEEAIVYGFEVGEDNSFCVAGAATHNTTIPGGETRLPGPGYESIYRLHSGIPGVYDAYDRYQILAGVAPNSRSFRHYKTIVDGWVKAGVLDGYWTRRYEQTEGELEAKKQGRFVERRFTGKTRGLDQINEGLKYNGFERAIGGAWEVLTHDVIADVPIVGTKLLKARTALEAYKEEQLYGETFRDWAHPYESFVRPHFEGAIASHPLDAVGRGGMASLFGANPVAATVLGAAGGVFAGAGSLVRMAATGQAEGGWIPEHRRRDFELMEYFDKLEYLRAKRLEGIALMAGDTEEARLYRRDAERTVAGLPAGASIGQVQAALPANVKPYFRGLLGVATESREDVLGLLPAYLRPAFGQVWGMNGKTETDETTAEYLSGRGIPADDSLAWHPQVPLDLTKIRFVESGANSVAVRMHHFGLWEGRVAESPVASMAIEIPRLDLESPGVRDVRTREAILDELRRVRALEATVSGGTGYAPASRMEITRDRGRRFRRVVSDYTR